MSVVVVVSILVPAFFVILYSMQWGRDRSNAWLTTFFLTIFQSVFVIDPIKVLIITAIITCVLRKPDEEASGGDDLVDCGDPLYNAIVSHDEEYLHTHTALGTMSEEDVREILESRRTKLSKLTPVDPVTLEQQRDERIKSVRMRELLREGASYFAFLIVVIFLAHQARSYNSRRIHNDLSNLFLFNPNMAFEDVRHNKLITLQIYFKGLFNFKLIGHFEDTNPT